MTTQRPCAYTTLSPLGLALSLVLCARAVVGFAANVAEGVSDMVASVHCSRFTALPGGQCVIDTRDRAWHYAGLGRAEIRCVYDIAAMPGQEASLLDVLKRCQNDDPWAEPSLHPFRVDGVQIGFLPALVFDAVSEYLRVDQDGAKALQVQDSDGGRLPGITFRAECSSREARTEQMGRLALWLRHSGKFPDPLDGTFQAARMQLTGRLARRTIRRVRPGPIWQTTLGCLVLPGALGLCAVWPSYIWRASHGASQNHAAKAYPVGVHAGRTDLGPKAVQDQANVRLPAPGQQLTRHRWSGYYDNSVRRIQACRSLTSQVAGGITAGDGPMESMIRECGKEAGLPADLVAKYIKVRRLNPGARLTSSKPGL